MNSSVNFCPFELLLWPTYCKDKLFKEILEYVLKDYILDTLEDILHKISIRCSSLKRSDKSVIIVIMRQKLVLHEFAEMLDKT